MYHVRGELRSGGSELIKWSFALPEEAEREAEIQSNSSRYRSVGVEDDHGRTVGKVFAKSGLSFPCDLRT